MRQDNGGTVNSGTDQRHTASMREVISLASGANTISLDYAASTASDVPTIYQAIISIRRVV